MADLPFPADEKLLAPLRSPWKIGLWMLGKLPLAVMAGLRIESVTPERCSVSVPYGWRSTNPFRSTYFAALAMAAEMSSGALALLAVRSAPQSVAVIITGLDATFGKKATERTTFTCEDGGLLFAAVAKAMETGEGVTQRVTTVGRSESGEEVARFGFEWSFKRRG